MEKEKEEKVGLASTAPKQLTKGKSVIKTKSAKARLGVKALRSKFEKKGKEETQVLEEGKVIVRNEMKMAHL